MDRSEKAVSIATLIIAILSLLLGIENCERSKSDPFIQIYPNCVRFIKLKGEEGVWLSWATFLAKNVGERPAVNAEVEWRHWDGNNTWLDPVGPSWISATPCHENPSILGREKMQTIKPGDIIEATASSDTAADPLNKLRLYQWHLPFALRITWYNPQGRRFRKIYYYDIYSRSSGNLKNPPTVVRTDILERVPLGIPEATF